jgi:hypothetical protein
LTALKEEEISQLTYAPQILSPMRIKSEILCLNARRLKVKEIVS